MEFFLVGHATFVLHIKVCIPKIRVTSLLSFFKAQRKGKHDGNDPSFSSRSSSISSRC